MRHGDHSQTALDDFILSFRKIARSCRIFPGNSVAIEVLINPASGYFNRKHGQKMLGSVLREFVKHPAKDRDIREEVSVRFHETTSVENLVQEVIPVIETLAADVGTDCRILVLAGGDGFHKDVCQAVMLHDPGIFSRLHLVRLPLGTGNDTADVGSLREICELFLSEGATKGGSALRISFANGETHYAFNVASFGIDAFISHLTNTFKGTFRGDVFRLMVDFATLFYDFLYRTGTMSILCKTAHGIRTKSGRFILCVLGTSGDTTYGGGKRILPGGENFLLADYIGVPKRILIKNRFMNGTHTGLSIAHMFRTSEVRVSYTDTILFEMDGEVVKLDGHHFPVTLTVVPDCLSIVTAR